MKLRDASKTEGTREKVSCSPRAYWLRVALVYGVVHISPPTWFSDRQKNSRIVQARRTHRIVAFLLTINICLAVLLGVTTEFTLPS